MPEPVVNLPREVWASIPGYPGYWVSSEGRVRSPRGVLTAGAGAKGYPRVTLGTRMRLVHRLVALAFLANPEGYPLVRHLDGTTSNSRATNLAWGTVAMNTADAQSHGTLPTAQHGTNSMYHMGCRCPACRAAGTAHHRAWRARKMKEASRG